MVMGRVVMSPEHLTPERSASTADVSTLVSSAIVTIVRGRPRG
jgi:hypothetical protein